MIGEWLSNTIRATHANELQRQLDFEDSLSWAILIRLLMALLQASWVHVYLSYPFFEGPSLWRRRRCGCCHWWQSRAASSKKRPSTTLRDGSDNPAQEVLHMVGLEPIISARGKKWVHNPGRCSAIRPTANAGFFDISCRSIKLINLWQHQMLASHWLMTYLLLPSFSPGCAWP